MPNTSKKPAQKSTTSTKKAAVKVAPVKQKAAPVEKQEKIGVPTAAMVAAGVAILDAGMPGGPTAVVMAMAKAPGALDHFNIPTPDAPTLAAVQLRNGMSHDGIAAAWYAAACAGR